MAEAPILFSFRRCPYAMRARLALLASGQECIIREVKLAAKPAEMLDASPKGTAPVLLLPNGQVIDESLDVMRWALGRSDPLGLLARDGPALIAATDGAFKYHLDRYKYPDRYASDPTEHRTAGLAFLHQLDEQLRQTSWLGGSYPGLADIAVMPFIRQFAAVDHGWFTAQPLTALQAWLERLLASPLFAAAMVRLIPWQPGDPPILFPALPLAAKTL